MSERKCVRSTSRNVAGLIPDSGPGISRRFSPSGRNMVLDSTQPLTETCTRNVTWRVKAAGARAGSLTTFMCRYS